MAGINLCWEIGGKLVVRELLMVFQFVWDKLYEILHIPSDSRSFVILCAWTTSLFTMDCNYGNVKNVDIEHANVADDSWRRDYKITKSNLYKNSTAVHNSTPFHTALHCTPTQCTQLHSTAHCTQLQLNTLHSTPLHNTRKNIGDHWAKKEKACLPIPRA
jgi:hypothetical protein